MERNFYTPLAGYQFCEDHDDGTDVFTLYTNANGVGYILKALKAEPHTTKYSTFTKSFTTTLWNFNSNDPRISAGEYYFWHNHSQNKTNEG